MIEWEKYVKWGDFISTNGIPLKYKWEFDRLDKYKNDKNIILASILCLAHPYNIVGIHTINPTDLKQRCKAIYYPDTNTSDGIVDYKYVLYDDVVTTGTSMVRAIEKYGKRPEKYICIVDRRDEVTQHVECQSWRLNIISILNKLNKVKK